MQLKQEFKDIGLSVKVTKRSKNPDRDKLIAYMVQLITELIFKGFVSGNEWKLTKAIFLSPIFLAKLFKTIWKIGMAFYLYFTDIERFREMINKHKEEFIF